jgi:hypothetical protein
MNDLRRAALIATAIWMLILGNPFAQDEGPIDETRFTLRHEMLRMINHDRKRAGLTPVDIDPATSALADAYCERQIRNGTTGHFTTDGLAPYMRYSLGGGNDGVSENAAAWSANYRFDDRALLDLLRQSEEAMLAETPPHDGHRKTILDPQATHVGIGMAWRGGELRLAQEFLRKYLDWSRPLPRRAIAGAHQLCSGKPRNGYRIDAVTVHREPLPQPMSATVANLITTYSLPNERREYLPRLGVRRWTTAEGEVKTARQEYSDGRRGDFQVADDGTFAFAVPFTDGPGVYTVVIWVRKEGDTTSFAASNVSVQVEAPSSPRYATAGVVGSR